MLPTRNSLGQMISAWRYQRGWAHYGYDAFGRRVRRTAPDGTVMRYLYDGDDLLAELDGATGQTIREYTYYPGVDRPHSVRAAESGATYYYATDHPGNVVGLINAAQQLENEYRYQPFGEVQVVKENIAQPLRFAAREWDDMPGLYQVRARWYDPQMGRFVSEDPSGLAGGINPYRYANNNPINDRDPSGLEEECIDWYMVTINVETGEVISERKLYTTCSKSGGGAGGGSGEGSATNGEDQACRTPPPGPPGVSVDRNMREARRHVNPVWFYNQVRNGGPWDYKQHETFKGQYEAFGNFNYGATGNAFGFPMVTLLEEAGRAQIKLVPRPRRVRGHGDIREVGSIR